MADIDANTKLMLHMDGPDGGTKFFDSSPSQHTVTANSGAQIDTAESVFGGASGLFNGSSDFLSIPDHADFDLAGSDSQDYTIDFRAKFIDHAGIEAIINQRENGDNYWQLSHTHGGGFNFILKSNTTTVVNLTAGGEVTDTNKHHIALVKVTNAGPTVEWAFYVDGVQVNYVSDSSIDTFAASIFIAKRNGGDFFDGNLDEFRITQGNPFNAAPVSGLTDTITVPTAAYQADPNDADMTLSILSVQGFTGALADNITIPQFTVDAIGGPALADITLPGLTVQGEQKNHVQGSVALPIITTTFVGLTGSIDGTTLNLPTFTINIRTGLTNAILLPQLSLAGVGFSGFRGTYAKSLPRMTVNVKATVHRNATFNVSLPAFTLDNTLLTGNISLASTRNLPGLTINATGFRGENGDGAMTFPMFTMANESYQSLNGTVVQSLKMLTLDAYGDSYTNRII